jgi:hypothetical protein
MKTALGLLRQGLLRQAFLRQAWRRWILASACLALLYVISDFSPVRAANSAEKAALVKSGAMPAKFGAAHDTSTADDDAQQIATSEPGTALTIYNQNFFCGARTGAA